MKTTRRWQVGLVCVMLMALLMPAALAQDFIGGGPYTVDYLLPSPPYDSIIQDATVNFETGAELAAWGNTITAIDGSVLNINDIIVGDYSAIFVTDDSVVNYYGGVFGPEAYMAVTTDGVDPKYNADVTIHGTDFKIDGVAIDSGDPLPSGVVFEDGKYYMLNNVVSGVKANGDPFEIPVQCLEVSEGNGVYSRTYVKLGAGPSVIEVIVDIKPGSVVNSINLGSMGVIPVGILSTADFDATTVDPWTVELAGSGVAVRGKGSKLMSSIKDLNGDGLLDLDVKVETENLDPGLFQDGTAILTGKTYDGLDITGSDSITIVPVG